MEEDIAVAVLYVQMCVPEPSNKQNVYMHQQTKPNLMHSTNGKLEIVLSKIQTCWSAKWTIA